jgi:2,5-diketo-D-gluconate reductase B
MQVIEANGAEIPVPGLGTSNLRGQTCERIVERALRLGYRHIDTAEMYGNERAVGEGIRGSGVKREEIFITTKVWPTNLAPRQLERSTKQSLEKLGLSEVNLLLIHWPNQDIPLAETIGALCKMKQEGYACHIGVANFTVPLIEKAAKLSTEPLVTNQIEWHPYLDQSQVVAACMRRGISVTAYCPLAQGKAADDKLLAAIGLSHGKTAGQVCLRFLVQQGAIVIPRTSKVERLSENMAIFDFGLSAAEMKRIRGLAQRSGRIVDWSGAPAWD